MDFFQRQDNARRLTRYLVMLFLAAVVGIVVAVNLVAAMVLGGGGTVANIPGSIGYWFSRQTGAAMAVTAGTLALIFFASLFRMASMRSGGSSVAKALGGVPVSPDTRNPQERRLRNVVEEMAIASALPVPEIYVLEQEQGINAFAAGFTPADAAIAVTRGTLEQLDRDQLQGVIAHEFSHILNGDMRLNLRLVGLLFGILVIGMLGRVILRSGRLGEFRVRDSLRSRGTAVTGLVGLSLLIIGYVGVFFGRLIKAGVSRQREYLADAAAVQFTRQSEGIAGALKKIAASADGSRLRASDPEEVSHMLFARGSGGWTRWMSTHPPIQERIRVLDPSYRPQAASATPGHTVHAAAAGFATLGGAPAGVAEGTGRGPSAALVSVLAGSPGQAQLEFASKLVHRLPESLLEDLHSSLAGPRVILALFVKPDPGERREQISLLAGRLGNSVAAEIQRQADLLRQLDRQFRLPLLELGFPCMRKLPPQQLEFYLELATDLVSADNHVEPHEFALLQVFSVYVHDLGTPQQRPHRGLSGKALKQATARIFAYIAWAGQADQQSAELAYQEALASTFPGQPATQLPVFVPPEHGIPPLTGDLRLLDRLPADGKRRLLQGLARLVEYDGAIQVQEAELLRCVAASVHVPLPPLLPPYS